MQDNTIDDFVKNLPATARLNNHLAKTEIFDILRRSFLSIGNLCVALDLKVEVN